MRKRILQMVEKHYPSVKFQSAREVLDAVEVWDWTLDGLIAISTASSDPELAQLAHDNGCADGEYMLVDAKTRAPRTFRQS